MDVELSRNTRANDDDVESTHTYSKELTEKRECEKIQHRHDAYIGRLSKQSLCHQHQHSHERGQGRCDRDSKRVYDSCNLSKSVHYASSSGSVNEGVETRADKERVYDTSDLSESMRHTDLNSSRKQAEDACKEKERVYTDLPRDDACWRVVTARTACDMLAYYADRYGEKLRRMVKDGRGGKVTSMLCTCKHICI